MHSWSISETDQILHLWPVTQYITVFLKAFHDHMTQLICILYSETPDCTIELVQSVCSIQYVFFLKPVEDV